MTSDARSNRISVRARNRLARCNRLCKSITKLSDHPLEFAKFGLILRSSKVARAVASSSNDPRRPHPSSSFGCFFSTR